MSKNKEINVEKIVNHWIKSSDDDFDTMNFLFQSEKYNWALFLGHISTEKLLTRKIHKILYN